MSASGADSPFSLMLDPGDARQKRCPACDFQSRKLRSSPIHLGKAEAGVSIVLLPKEIYEPVKH